MVMIGRQAIRALHDAGLLPPACHAVEISMPIEKVVGITYHCYLSGPVMKVLGEELLASAAAEEAKASG